MSSVIGILNPKGGSGKTTLATNLARALQRDGARVLIVDTDPQGTARDWQARQSDDADSPGVVAIENARALRKELTRLGEGYDFLVIDGSAKVQGMMGAAVKASDAVLIPVRPSPADLWAVNDLVEVIQSRREITEGSPLAAFVVSQAVTGANLSEQVTEALASYELPTFEARTGGRVAYAECMIAGATVLDSAGSKKAAGEIQAIKRELLHLLKATQT